MLTELKGQSWTTEQGNEWLATYKPGDPIPEEAYELAVRTLKEHNRIGEESVARIKKLLNINDEN